ncbi:MAG TPA: BadF/BadG/BcrA/BcrD ATPase family protein [Gemmatimonadales bacterium]|nr:BadF/BadG/BcrA/BcrD ATPase family protein [Gemmatimonadales bacterium]
MRELFIGVDVGGTKTVAAVGDATAELGRADGPGAAVRPGRALVSAGTITEVARRALAAAGAMHAAAMVVGAAGAGREPERTDLREALRAEGLAERLVVTTDIEIALAAAFGPGPGIVVSAGTGSIAVGRDSRGALHRIGGYGWQMGDEGSGYAIGRAALGAVGRAADGRSAPTALQERVLAATRSADLDALVRWAASAGPAEVASLAPHVLAVAAEGDIVARGIADYAARELSQLAKQLLPALDADRPVPVAVTGGLLAPARLLYGTVLEKLREDSDLAVRDQPIDAAAGALAMARS